MEESLKAFFGLEGLEGLDGLEGLEGYGEGPQGLGPVVGLLAVASV